MERFYRQKEGGAIELLQNKRKDCFRPGHLLFERKGSGRGLMKIILLVLIRILLINCSKFTFLEEDLVIRSWFAVMGANDSIWGLFFLF